MPLLQREVVSNAEKPTPKILARTAQVKMPKQGQEHLLDHLFPIVDRHSEGHAITEQWTVELVK
jgi:hypothetical protein